MRAGHRSTGLRAAAIAGIAAVAIARAAAGEAGIVSWRGDGTGKPAGAAPPARWGGGKGGISWSTAVGKSPNSSPIVAGGRVYVVAEPADLVCLDAAGGKVLWRSSCGFRDLHPPLDDRPVPGTAGNVTPTPAAD